MFINYSTTKIRSSLHLLHSDATVLRFSCTPINRSIAGVRVASNSRPKFTKTVSHRKNSKNDYYMKSNTNPRNRLQKLITKLSYAKEKLFKLKHIKNWFPKEVKQNFKNSISIWLCVEEHMFKLMTRTWQLTPRRLDFVRIDLKVGQT